MSKTDQYKSPRRGVLSPGGRGVKRHGRNAVSADVPTPDIAEFGHAPFTDSERQALAQQLLDERWPRGTLNIHGLEGLLTALLVLPLGLRPGTWLPRVWNESGWRIPPVIPGPEQFHQFIESIVGFMRMIDAGLGETPPRIASTLNAPAEGQAPLTPAARSDWAEGFCLAVSQSDNFKLRPDGITYDALFAIAVHSNPSSEKLRHGRKPSATLEQAVSTLAMARAARGPLGPLES